MNFPKQIDPSYGPHDMGGAVTGSYSYSERDAAMPATVSPVISAIHALGDEQQRTDKLLAELQEKLQPVLSVLPEAPTSSGPKPAPLRQSPLHGRVLDYIENQEAINGVISRVIQRLTV